MDSCVREPGRSESGRPLVVSLTESMSALQNRRSNVRVCPAIPKPAGSSRKTALRSSRLRRAACRVRAPSAAHCTSQHGARPTLGWVPTQGGPCRRSLVLRSRDLRSAAQTHRPRVKGVSTAAQGSADVLSRLVAARKNEVTQPEEAAATTRGVRKELNGSSG
jgi:hypothetical protein